MDANLLWFQAQRHPKQLGEVYDFHLAFISKFLFGSDLVHLKPAMTGRTTLLQSPQRPRFRPLT